MDTPIVFVIFNRPETTARVFEVIRQAQPRTLLVVADGPRPGHPDDVERCAAARASIKQVDWDCEVLKNYADENLGCRKGPASGFTWAFETVEEAIILEDDCVPHPSFFPYCETLLDYYRRDTRVMHINGNNYGIDQSAIHPYSYSFCRFPQAWGWATWRRAWKYFDENIEKWPAFRDGGFMQGLNSKRRFSKRQALRWESAYRGSVDTWDFQWHFTVMSQHGLTISPTRNLISNIGFSEDATHTLDKNSFKADLESHPMGFPLRHPPLVFNHPAIDKIYESAMLDDSRISRLLGKARRLLRSRA